MTSAERIRNYLAENPKAKHSEIAEVLGVGEGTIRATISKDARAGKCVRSEEGVDYSPYFNKVKETEGLLAWKNENRRVWVEMLTSAAEKETDSNTMRLLIKEANKLMKEVME